MRLVLSSMVERSATFCLTDLATQFNKELTHVVDVGKHVAVVQVEHAIHAHCQRTRFAEVRYNLLRVTWTRGCAIVDHHLARLRFVGLSRCLRSVA